MTASQADCALWVTEVMSFDHSFCFAVDRRVTFFCIAKRRVTKEKATHLATPFAKGANGVPCAAQPAGRLRNSVAMRPRPQTVLADIPRPASAARRLRWGPKSKAEVDGPQVLRYSVRWPSRDAFDLAFDLPPMRRAEQRRSRRKKGEDCLRAGALSPTEFRSPRLLRVAQGTRSRLLRTGAEPGSPFYVPGGARDGIPVGLLATFLLAKQKKSTLARQGRNHNSNQTS